MSTKSYIEYNNMVKQKDETGFYNLESDKLAIKYYMGEIKKTTMFFNDPIEKIHYLINNGYYVDFFKLYTEEQVLDIHKYINSFHFKFDSFMAISKFYETYALKTWDKSTFLEDYADRVLAVALFLGDGKFDDAMEFATVMITQQYQPATPTFLNSGKAKTGELVSCFLLEMDDSLNSINYNISTSMQLSKIGGGVAINLSKLRSRGEEIKGIKGVGRGILPVAKLLEDAFNYVDQLGQRPGAGAVYLNIFHADVIEFLDTKKINADEKNRIQTLSLGLVVPDKFLELAKKNEDIHMFHPYSVRKEYGIHLDDMDLNVMYDELVDNANVDSKVLPARDLLQKIAMTQFESGYPYLVYIDKANEANPLKESGRIKISNLCTEIFQNQTTSKITDYDYPDEIGYDISCNLGSLNLVNLMEEKTIEKTVNSATRALTVVSEKSQIANAPGVRKANKNYHSVGLGVMNLHGYLTKNKIAYESDDAKDFVNVLFPIINFYSIKSSCQIAKIKGEAFTDFETSEYANGNYFDKYLEESFVPKSDKVAALFEGIYIPSIKDWELLKLDVQKHGLYNAYRMAIAPTQSISYIQNATASIQPIVDVVETRMYGNSLTYYPMPFLNRENHFFYKSAYFMNQEKIIDLVATIQPHVDQGISTVLYVTSDASTKDLARLYYYAWAKGLKSLYYIRTKNLTVEECESCSV
ncbi:MAG: class 1b ribonucleoside-diphosphate reductase subunit alpha [Mycoplasmatales bacterium]